MSVSFKCLPFILIPIMKYNVKNGRLRNIHFSLLLEVMFNWSDLGFNVILLSTFTFQSRFMCRGTKQMEVMQGIRSWTQRSAGSDPERRSAIEPRQPCVNAFNKYAVCEIYQMLDCGHPGYVSHAEQM